MREIKFRAWDGNKIVLIDGWKLKNGVLECDGATIMQFTGLKDKNGKECFEGDIYTCGYEREDGTHKYGDINVVKDIRDFRPEDSFEIIGNIYENPELLPLNKVK